VYFLNQQSAVAHQRVFQEIEKIVEIDTGQRLKWRHLHASAVDDYVGILHWAADQHGGQAKGKIILCWRCVYIVYGRILIFTELYRSWSASTNTHTRFTHIKA
jgi:hypothetical protein